MTGVGHDLLDECIISESELDCGEDFQLSFLQVDGAEDSVPVFNGLTGIQCEVTFISHFINLFRSLESEWSLFENHKVCNRSKKESGNHCAFCAIRSVSLRVNRAKTRRNIKPVELTSILDQLPCENKTKKDFQKQFLEALETIFFYEDNASRYFLGSHSECISCDNSFSISESLLLSLKDTK